jgi:hypothetical protein
MCLFVLDVTVYNLTFVDPLTVGDSFSFRCNITFWHSSRVNKTLPVNVTLGEIHGETVPNPGLSCTDCVFIGNFSITGTVTIIVSASVSYPRTIQYACIVWFGDSKASSSTPVLLISGKFQWLSHCIAYKTIITQHPLSVFYKRGSFLFIWFAFPLASRHHGKHSCAWPVVNGLYAFSATWSNF